MRKNVSLYASPVNHNGSLDTQQTPLAIWSGIKNKWQYGNSGSGQDKVPGLFKILISLLYMTKSTNRRGCDIQAHSSLGRGLLQPFRPALFCILPR